MNFQCQGDVTDPFNDYTERFPWDADRLNNYNDYCYVKHHQFNICVKCQGNLKLFAIIKLQANEIEFLKQEIEELRSR